MTNAGHHNRPILDAAKAQADKLVHACTYVYHVPSRSARSPRSSPRSRPASCRRASSATAAPRPSRAPCASPSATRGKNEFVAIESSFHGRTYATLSVTGNSGRKKGGGPYMPGVAFAPTPYCYRCPPRPRPRSCDLLCARRVRRGRPPAPLGRRLRLHRRARDGRGRHHRAAGRLLQAPSRRSSTRRASCSSPTRCRAASGAPASCSPSSTSASCRTS